MEKELHALGFAIPSDASEATDASLARTPSVASVGSLHTFTNAVQNEEVPRSPSNILAQQHHPYPPKQPCPLHHAVGTPMPPAEPLELGQQAWAVAKELATCATCPSKTERSLRHLVQLGYGPILRSTRDTRGRSLLELAAISECFDGVEAVCTVLPELAREVMHVGRHTLTPDQLETVQRVLDEMAFRLVP